MNIKEKLENLISKSNTTTEKSDTNMTDCVNSLIEGYGQGGGSDLDIYNSLKCKLILEGYGVNNQVVWNTQQLEAGKTYLILACTYVYQNKNTYGLNFQNKIEYTVYSGDSFDIRLNKHFSFTTPHLCDLKVLLIQSFDDRNSVTVTVNSNVTGYGTEFYQIYEVENIDKLLPTVNTECNLYTNRINESFPIASLSNDVPSLHFIFGICGQGTSYCYYKNFTKDYPLYTKRFFEDWHHNRLRYDIGVSTYNLYMIEKESEIDVYQDMEKTNNAGTSEGCLILSIPLVERG